MSKRGAKVDISYARLKRLVTGYRAMEFTDEDVINAMERDHDIQKGGH